MNCSKSESDDVLEKTLAERTLSGSPSQTHKSLSEARRSAGTLTKDVHSTLETLGMTGARLVVEMVPARAGLELGDFFVGPTGLDRLRLLQTNPGDTPMPVEKIASGGEPRG